MSYSQDWLNDQEAIRGVLVEASVSINGAADTIIYLSNIGFMTSDSLISFNPVISNSVSISDSLSLDNQVSMSFGDIEINNPNGDLDVYLGGNYIWTNRPIKVYVGDPRWVVSSLAELHDANVATSKFKKVFDGTIEDLDSRSRATLNIKVRDKLQRLNTPITEIELGNTGVWGGSGTGGASGTEAQATQKNIIPLVFGEVHNIEPLLEDPSLLKYRTHNGPIELLIEVRDNGVPLYTHNGFSATLNPAIAPTIDETLSRITLKASLAGTLTVSLQGAKHSINLANGAELVGTYNNNPANLIALVATKYGNAALRLTAGDLDLPVLAAFQTSDPKPVGIAIYDKANTLVVCQELAGSIGAQVHMSPEGKLGLVRLGTYTTAGVTFTDVITDNDILHHSLEISNKTTVRAATRINYCKNWTIQDELLTAIPKTHKNIFSKEYAEPVAEALSTTVRDLYVLTETPDPESSLLLRLVDAEAEALRRNNFFKVPRTVYKFTGTSKLMSLVLGQEVTIVHNRFNLYNSGNGKSGQVISLTQNWGDSTVDVEVIISNEVGI